jgi:hypothetical protein
MLEIIDDMFSRNDVGVGDFVIRDNDQEPGPCRLAPFFVQKEHDHSQEALHKGHDEVLSIFEETSASTRPKPY